jgi:hypothetical protein
MTKSHKQFNEIVLLLQAVNKAAYARKPLLPRLMSGEMAV